MAKAPVTSQRVRSLSPPWIHHFNREVPPPRGTISLGQGVPFFPTPKEVLTAARNVEDGARYSPDPGLPELRKACAQKVRRENGINASADNIVVTAGANQGFVNALMAIADVGDEVVMVSPYYFNHEMAVRMAGCVPRFVEVGDDFVPYPDQVKKALSPKTRAVITISPNNPTGTIYPKEVLGEINELCGDRGIWHISDEPYEYFLFEGEKHVSPGSLPGAAEHTISLFSFSKSFSMAGWRVGFMVIPDSISEAVMKVQDTLVVCAPVPSQRGALAALKLGPSHLERYSKDMELSRKIILEGLEDMDPVDLPHVPKGAYYLFPRIRTRKSSWEVAKRLVEEHRVQTIPGTAFGRDWPCHIRLSFGNVSQEDAREAIRRIKDGL